jgi:hypothetical protein
MRQVKQKIKDLRPPLRVVAPMTFYITVGFGVLNLVLGLALINTPESGGLAIVGKYTPMWLYGVLFLVLGIFGLAVVYKNDWKWIRRTLIMGMLYKSIWFFALLASLFHGGSIAILGLWLFLIHVQAITYIFFIPAPKIQEPPNGRPASV